MSKKTLQVVRSAHICIWRVLFS